MSAQIAPVVDMLQKNGGEISKQRKTKRATMRISSEQSDNDASQRKKAKNSSGPSELSRTPAVKYTRNDVTRAAASKRGHAEVVDLAILYLHKPETLKAFLDTDIYPNFSFVRKEKDDGKQDLMIERTRKGNSVILATMRYENLVALRIEADHTQIGYQTTKNNDTAGTKF
ncbi:hypothetical protein MMC21_000739 [Puttea exsequens]|nr:hypothetical protein [Puttea exsequens]